MATSFAEGKSYHRANAAEVSQRWCQTLGTTGLRVTGISGADTPIGGVVRVGNRLKARIARARPSRHLDSNLEGDLKIEQRTLSSRARAELDCLLRTNITTLNTKKSPL